jgi:hypothetical protein
MSAMGNDDVCHVGRFAKPGLCARGTDGCDAEHRADAQRYDAVKQMRTQSRACLSCLQSRVLTIYGRCEDCQRRVDEDDRRNADGDLLPRLCETLGWSLVPAEDALQRVTDLRALVQAAHRVAVLQPAAGAKNQDEADRWAAFYTTLSVFVPVVHEPARSNPSTEPAIGELLLREKDRSRSYADRLKKLDQRVAALCDKLGAPEESMRDIGTLETRVAVVLRAGSVAVETAKLYCAECTDDLTLEEKTSAANEATWIADRVATLEEALQYILRESSDGDAMHAAAVALGAPLDRTDGDTGGAEGTSAPPLCEHGDECNHGCAFLAGLEAGADEDSTTDREEPETR